MCHHCLKSLDGFSRREMLVSAAGTAIIGGLLARQAQAAETAASRPATAREMPEIRAAFLRPKQDYWLGWPGTAWDKNMSGPFMEKSKKLVGQFASDMKMRVTWAEKPLYDEAAVATVHCRRQGRQAGRAPVCSRCTSGTGPWSTRSRPPASRRSSSPRWASASPATSRRSPSSRACTWLRVRTSISNPVRFGMRMIKAHNDIRRTKIAVLSGRKGPDEVLEPFGLGVRYLPRERFTEALATVQTDAEVRAIADDYKKAAAKSSSRRTRT